MHRWRWPCRALRISACMKKSLVLPFQILLPRKGAIECLQPLLQQRFLSILSAGSNVSVLGTARRWSNVARSGHSSVQNFRTSYAAAEADYRHTIAPIILLPNTVPDPSSSGTARCCHLGAELEHDVLLTTTESYQGAVGGSRPSLKLHAGYCRRI